MTQRTSLVGGFVSFVAVALLSCLSLDMVEDGGFFMQELELTVVDTPTAGENSSKTLCVEEIH